MERLRYGLVHVEVLVAAKLSAERLLKLRDHGVTPAYISAMSAAGFGKLSAEDLLELRDHGVTPVFIEGLAKAGYTRLSAEELLNGRRREPCRFRD